MEELPLDPDTADRILSGQVAPDDAPPGYAALSALIRAAHQAPAGDEVPGEEVAVEQMLASMAAPREWTAPPSRRRGRGMRMRAAVVATVTVVASTSGFAAAGALPRGAQSVVSKVLGSVGLDIPDPAETTELAATAGSTGEDEADVEAVTRPERETTTTEAAAVSSSTSSSTTSSSTTTTAAPAATTGDECPTLTDDTVDGTTGDTTTSSSSSSTSTSSSSTTTTSTSTTSSTTTTTTQPEGESTTTTASDGSTTTTTIAADPECADDAASEVTDSETGDDSVSSPTKVSSNGEARAAGRRQAAAGTPSTPEGTS